MTSKNDQKKRRESNGECTKQEIHRISNKLDPGQGGAIGGKPLEKPQYGESHQVPSSQSPGPIQAFFANYAPYFRYNPTISSSQQFYRLCNQSGWDKEHPDRQSAYEKFQDALVLQFNKTYGTSVNSLETWQSLCGAMGIYPIPGDLDTCREAVRKPFVNFVDLVDTKRTGVKVELFMTEQKLREYTRSTGKCFPRENKNAGRVLRSLLQRPRDTASGRHKGAKGRR